jgi:hypothetical protein
MNETKNRWAAAGMITFSAAVLSGLLATGLLATIYAQESTSQFKSGQGLVVYSKSVRTVPESGSKVTLRLIFDNGAVFRVTQFEGAMIRIIRNGTTIGLAAHIDVDHWNQVSAKVFNVVPVAMKDVDRGESITEMGSFDIGREASELPNGDLGVKVEVLGIAYEVGNTDENKKTSRVHLLNREGECCVTCSGITVCGGAVDAPCGSCCVGSFC